MALYLAADIGGTFTDFVVLDDETKELDSFKVFTTYPDRSVGLLEGIDRAVAARGRSYADIALFSHGSTVATNALVEMKGARCGLLTTAGFRDLLELRRQKRPHLYDLQADKPLPLVPRQLRLEVEERVMFDGSVLLPLSEPGVLSAGAELVQQGVEAVAVMYLNSYANPAHELRTKELLAAAFPQLAVFTSAEVLPQFREFERLSTTVVNAFVSPPIRTYVDRLESELRRRGCYETPLLMKGDGGVATPLEAMRAAVSTIGSGPTGGVRGAELAAAEAAETSDLITFDMGGTSTDISLVIAGKPLTTDLREVGGWPIRGAAADIVSIGAGGGSIAWIDAGGLLRVGPHSAGSTPGPACYGRGGELPTITDANLVLGRLESLLGGEYPLRLDLAEAAITTHVATPLGMSLARAAEGILAVATAHMEQAIRLMTVARGHDPRGFALVTFGGAGALHGPAVARNLGIKRVLVPGSAGVLSARGVLSSRLTKDFSSSRLLPLTADNLPAIKAVLGGLESSAREWAASQAAESGASKPASRPGAEVTLAVDVRCHGQNYELSVAVEGGADGHDLAGQLEAGFHAAHERAYGYAFTGASLECVTYRASARQAGSGSHLDGLTGVKVLTSASRSAGEPSRSPTTRLVVWEAASPPRPTLVYRDMPTSEPVTGPALIERDDATVTVWPGQVARRAPGAGIVIDTAAPERLSAGSPATEAGRPA
ncbi:MAG TPA: hydantoinase/oxoprolinase family protein [Trueperaceae bacterium]|nr:hydantoinase/oxoprolinase family protein [Trueperaceae bacterium]